MPAVCLCYHYLQLLMHTYYLQHERPCCIGYTNSSRRREFVYPIQHGRSKVINQKLGHIKVINQKLGLQSIQTMIIQNVHVIFSDRKEMHNCWYDYN